MHWIAHRGNVFGRRPERENSERYIEEALQRGFDVEIDIWWKDGSFHLGHDGPQYPTSVSFLVAHSSKLWIHAKHNVSLQKLLEIQPALHIFSHDRDDAVLTTKKVIWTYPGAQLVEGCVCVMPERVRGAYPESELTRLCSGICSDYVGWYRQRHECKVRLGMLIGGRWTCHQENILPQVRNYLAKHPDAWIDLHLSLNGDAAKEQQLLQDQWMDAPFIATLSCLDVPPFPPSYDVHPRKMYKGQSSFGVMSMFFHNARAFELLLQYGAQYDLVIKYRPDIVRSSGEMIDWLQFLRLRNKSDKVAIPLERMYHGANDQVAVGSVDVMRVYCDVYRHIAGNLEDPNKPHYLLHPETMLRIQLEENNIEVEGFHYEYDLDVQRRAEPAPPPKIPRNPPPLAAAVARVPPPAVRKVTPPLPPPLPVRPGMDKQSLELQVRENLSRGKMKVYKQLERLPEHRRR